jgi:lysophospholipase L1-like esterase
MNTINKERIEPLKTIIIAYRFRDSRIVEKMLENGWFLLSREGLKKFADRYFEKKS